MRAWLYRLGWFTVASWRYMGGQRKQYYLHFVRSFRKFNQLYLHDQDDDCCEDD